MFDLIRYLAFTIVEGDHLNDWLTHIPVDLQPMVESVGYALTLMFS